MHQSFGGGARTGKGLHTGLALYHRGRKGEVGAGAVNAPRRLHPHPRPHPHPQVDAGKEINVISAINDKVITRGLKYSLATGNWGEQGKQGIRAGERRARQQGY